MLSLTTYIKFIAGTLFAVQLLHVQAQHGHGGGQGGGGGGGGQGQMSSPYAPVFVECPKDLAVRNASEGLSKAEEDWRHTRSQHVIPALRSYLELVNITDFNVTQFLHRLNSSNAPVVGLSVSGGGTQSGMGGLGVYQAFDARYPPAVKARTGGLTQILTYMTGLSGGGALTVGSLAANNFSTVDSLRKAVNFSSSYETGPGPNVKKFYAKIFENAGAKAELGFPVSVADLFGQFWANWVPHNKTFSNYTDLAASNTSFTHGTAPMPILAIAEVVPGKSPQIHRIMYPGVNQTNGFNLTSYEVNPFEFGSWAGGRVQAFIPTKYLGTAMNKGKAQNNSQCVQGFDKLSFLQGTTTNAFAATLIDAFYNIPIFAKRSQGSRPGETRQLESRQHSSEQTDDIPIPPGEKKDKFVLLVNETASNFDQTFNQSLWATYPNPFQNYNRQMSNVSELLLVDGSLSGETNPIRPLIIPARNVDFIIVYEASSEANNSWVNGTNLINTARSAHEGGIPFPVIPDVNTMIAEKLNKQPTFFGCDAPAGNGSIPLILWLPNSPWTGYSNYSFMKPSFTDNQLNLTFENAFQLATYGNGTVDGHWPACLACATIKGSMARLKIDMPKQCEKCFHKHCWNGKNSTRKPHETDFNLKPRLNSSLTYDEWRKTEWDQGLDQKNQDDEKDSLATSLLTTEGLLGQSGLAIFVASAAMLITLM